MVKAKELKLLRKKVEKADRLEKKAIEKQAAKDGVRTAEWCRAKLMTAVALEKLQVKMEG